MLFLSLASLAAADFGVNLSNAAASATVLNSLVAEWSSPNGADSARVVSYVFTPLSSALANVGTGDMPSNVRGINGLTSSLSQLLENLASKAGDFKEVGVELHDNVEDLAGPVSAMLAEWSTQNADSPGVRSAIFETVDIMKDAWRDAFSSYSAEPVQFP